ncbi:MAG: methyltransferase [Patescibacteria group bacterium]
MKNLINFYQEVNRHSGQKFLLKDKEIIVDKEVFNPNTPTTKVMLDYMDQHPEIIQGKIVADCRCGCGVLGINAVLNGAKEVFFSDFSPLARINTEKNLKKMEFCKPVEVIESDLLEDIPVSLDVIFFSHALIPGQPKNGDWLEKNLFDDGQTLNRFFFQALTFLKRDGKIFIPFNRNIGDTNSPAIVSGRKRNLQVKVSYQQETPEGEIVIYEFSH